MSRMLAIRPHPSWDGWRIIDAKGEIIAETAIPPTQIANEVLPGNRSMTAKLEWMIANGHIIPWRVLPKKDGMAERYPSPHQEEHREPRA